MPSADARGQGQMAERAAARKYGLVVVSENTDRTASDWRDLTSPANGTNYQCKSAVYKRANGRWGVIRVSKKRLKQLEQKSKQAKVIIVLMSSVGSERRVLAIAKVSISEVRDVVDGRWYPETQEYEIPWPKLVSY